MGAGKSDGMTADRIGRRRELYKKILERAVQESLIKEITARDMEDIESADRMFRLRLSDWLHADFYGFTYDFIGIRLNINRAAFPSIDFGNFIPKFAGGRYEDNFIMQRFMRVT